MSQAAPTDTEPSADSTPPPDQPSRCEDVPAGLTPTSASPQPHVIPESFTESSEEAHTEDTSTKENTNTTKQPEVSTDHLQPAAEVQVIECDQPVSLEPEAEAADEHVEVINRQLY